MSGEKASNTRAISRAIHGLTWENKERGRRVRQHPTASTHHPIPAEGALRIMVSAGSDSKTTARPEVHDPGLDKAPATSARLLDQ